MQITAYKSTPSCLHLRARPQGAEVLSRFTRRKILGALGILPKHGDNWLSRLPFAPADATGGTEIELQAAVGGTADSVDLPLTIAQSNYFANIIRRTAAGDMPARTVSALEKFLQNNTENLWENSWVRLPNDALCAYARQIFNADLQADKTAPGAGQRRDAGRFFSASQGRAFIRVPISYLLKLALADAIGSQSEVPDALRRTAERVMDHLISDNTSPESSSFYICARHSARSLGQAVAAETSQRYLFLQLLIQYANTKLMLRASGQHAMIYFSPHPPIRQKLLNSCISDAFYRELFMSPCLSGWDRGEEKAAYMHLCHEVLSRSQLNGLAKLREAGIIARNLVVLPHTSNVSLANNGTHITLGSRRLTLCMKNAAQGFLPEHEKFLGDLACKIIEHFLPLFVGIHSAAPYRLDFEDFHPERVLGFLPHELDYTHLRMLWRRWRKKASLRPFGLWRSITPFGPVWLDRLAARLLRLHGDCVPDFRLLDYPVALLSTESNPAFDGRMGNQERLKCDLTELGVFNKRMSFYCLYRLREFSRMGFSGFEGRYYSLFPDLANDLAKAADLQHLLTAVAYKYIALGQISHAHIPDTPEVESERRQMFFGAAMGVPTFFVRQDTKNLFLRRIISRTERLRGSRRYTNYWRVKSDAYRRALVQLLREDAPDLIEMFGFSQRLNELEEQFATPQATAAGRLEQDILDEVGATSPCSVPAATFNAAAEKFYRTTLRRRHMCQALEIFADELAAWERKFAEPGSAEHQILKNTLPTGNAAQFCRQVASDILDEKADTAVLTKMINLFLIVYEHARTSVY